MFRIFDRKLWLSHIFVFSQKLWFTQSLFLYIKTVNSTRKSISVQKLWRLSQKLTVIYVCVCVHLSQGITMTVWVLWCNMSWFGKKSKRSIMWHIWASSCLRLTHKIFCFHCGKRQNLYTAHCLVQLKKSVVFLILLGNSVYATANSAQLSE